MENKITNNFKLKIIIIFEKIYNNLKMQKILRLILGKFNI